MLRAECWPVRRSRPASTLAKVTCPVLALGGTLDLQVPAEQNLPVIRTQLEAGGNRDVTVTSLAGLNHLFQTARTGSPAEYEEIEETMAPSVLDIVTNWVLAHAT
jgi:fermentation-respiration switch protein FrsA (DUF1100 family)